MPRPKKIQTPLKAKPKGKRPRCLNCVKELPPQFTIPPPMPVKLYDGRRKAERTAWEKEHKPRFTGHYGRYADDCFCGQACGYEWAVNHSPKRKK
jgi:hypothetical protein